MNDDTRNLAAVVDSELTQPLPVQRADDDTQELWPPISEEYTEKLPPLYGQARWSREQTSANEQTQVIATTPAWSSFGEPAPAEPADRDGPPTQRFAPVHLPRSYPTAPEPPYVEPPTGRPVPAPRPQPTVPQPDPYAQPDVVDPYGGGALDRPRRSVVRVCAHLLAIVVACAAFIVLAQAALWTAPGQRLDEQAMRQAHEALASEVSSQLLHLLDWLPIGAAIVGALALVITTLRTRKLMSALVCVIVAAGALGSVQVLKHVVLVKPNLGVQEAALNSFPSGHTAMAAIAGFVMVMIVPNRGRGWMGLLMAVATAVVAAGTVINAWHRPSDAIAAMVVCAAWALLGSMILYLVNGPGPRRGLSVAQVLAMGMGLAVAFVAVGCAFQSLRVGGGWSAAFGMSSILAASLICYSFVVSVVRHR